MKITTIINEFESNFASSFKHTSIVKYNIEFKTSIVDDIIQNLIDKDVSNDEETYKMR